MHFCCFVLVGVLILDAIVGRCGVLCGLWGGLAKGSGGGPMMAVSRVVMNEMLIASMGGGGP